MIAAGGGSIINTASQWGLHPAPGHIAYNTSNAAVVAFTQNLARDYGLHGVRVNAVCPGEVRTPMLESNLARSGRTLDDLNRLVPYGRIGEPEEIAALVALWPPTRRLTSPDHVWRSPAPRPSRECAS
jgi:2-hydroxycyclohexanecarboxyl-CoA dehydrogenase